MTSGAGLHQNGPDTHSKAKSGTAWLAAGPPPQWVVFDLKGPCDVRAVRVWNYNENQDRPLMNRGVKKLDVLVSADGKVFRRAGEFELKVAPGREDVDFSETFKLTQSDVRFVKFEISANHGDSEYVGLAEIRFLGSRRHEEHSPKLLATTWRAKFLRGEPALPAPFETTTLDSWTALGDERARWVAGTARYEARFTLPSSAAGDWILDLGRVADSARVRVNGHEVETLFSVPFSVAVGHYLRAGENLLEVDVTNLDANRISDLDRRGVVWRKFHEINFVNIHYRPFDASAWPPRDSGLLGPVRLWPVAVRQPTP